MASRKNLEDRSCNQILMIFQTDVFFKQTPVEFDDFYTEKICLMGSRLIVQSLLLHAEFRLSVTTRTRFVLGIRANENFFLQM